MAHTSGGVPHTAAVIGCNTKSAKTDERREVQMSAGNSQSSSHPRTVTDSLPSVSTPQWASRPFHQGRVTRAR
jgi:hypothetical protein